MAHALFLPIHRDLTIALKKQSACAANFQGFGLCPAESHFVGFFLLFKCRFIQHNPREIRRQRNLWKSEGVQYEISLALESELLPDYGIESHIGATAENRHVL